MRRLTILAAAAALLAGCTSPEDEIRTAVKRHLNQPDAADEVINILDAKPESAVVRIYTAGAPNTFPIFFLTRRDRVWKIEYEIHEDFTKNRVTTADFEKDYLTRMGQRMADRFNRAIKIKPGIPRTVHFDEADKTVLAKVGALYNASPEPGVVQDFYYSETYRFQDGQWIYDTFSLLDAVPRKPDR